MQNQTEIQAQKRSDLNACNVGENQQNEAGSLKTVKTVVFPKFFKQLNAQQNMKRKRQLRRKQQNIHQHLKQLIFQKIPGEQGNSVQPPILPIDQNQITLILQQAHQAKLLQEKKENYINGKPIKGKIFMKREQMIKDGNRIIGEWRNEQLHGDVEINYRNGFFFRGRYEHGIRIRGYFNFSNGYEYTGGFLGDKFRGYGELKLPNGKVICGDWQEELLDGKAEIRYPTGQVYYGQIKKFKKHGKGYLFFNDGQKYVGEFCEGHITGNGQYYEHQKLIGKGYWLDGQLMYQENDVKNPPIEKTQTPKKNKSALKNSNKVSQQRGSSGESKHNTKSYKKSQKKQNSFRETKNLKCSIVVIDEETKV